eukprot:12023120-Alexandrium_andersonii.AAC.1
MLFLSLLTTVWRAAVRQQHQSVFARVLADTWAVGTFGGPGGPEAAMSDAHTDVVQLTVEFLTLMGVR